MIYYLNCNAFESKRSTINQYTSKTYVKHVLTLPMNDTCKKLSEFINNYGSLCGGYIIRTEL